MNCVFFKTENKNSAGVLCADCRDLDLPSHPPTTAKVSHISAAAHYATQWFFFRESTATRPRARIVFAHVFV